MNYQLFTAFLLITVVLFLTPGPIVTLVIATGASQGIRAALVTVAGTTLGNAALIAAIALGLSFVIAHAATLFEILRWGGAAYLIWLGIQAWRSAGGDGAALPTGRANFGRGVLVALTARRRKPASGRRRPIASWPVKPTSACGSSAVSSCSRSCAVKATTCSSIA